MYKCKFCGREFKNKQQKDVHEKWCKENPENTKSDVEDNLDEMVESEDVTEDEKGEDVKLTKEQGEKLSRISDIAGVLRSYGITSGEDLLQQVDKKAREMPFYKEIADSIGSINAKVEQNSQDILSLTEILNDINAKLTNIMKNFSNVNPSGLSDNVGGNGSTPNTQQESNLPQQVQRQQQPQDASLEGWFDRLLKLIAVAGGGGGDTGPTEMPPEIKYKDLIELSQVLKSLQGDPYKQLREDLKLFVSIAKAFKTGNVPELESETETHLEE